HATTELGPVQKPAPGTFSVELKAEGGVLRADVMVQLDGEGERAGTSGFVRVDRATLRGTRAMLPGRYRFTVYGKNFRWLRGSVEVVAGETLTVRGTLRPAVRVGLRFHRPKGEDGSSFDVRDATGELVIDTELGKGVGHTDLWPF